MGVKKAEVEVECGLTQGKSVDCLVGEWTTDSDDCGNEGECDGGGTIMLSRKITVRPMCGGKQCGPLAEVKRCPDAPPCLFKTPQAVRTTFLLSGVDADTYDANDDAIKATIK